MDNYTPQTVRAWFRETNEYGENYDRQFCVDNPSHLPAIGAFVEAQRVHGWVTHIQYSYNPERLTITILLSSDKPG